MDKKARIASSLVDFVALLVIGLTFIVFFALFKVSSDVKNTIQEKAFPEILGNEFLLTYLKTPVEYNGETVTMADYLSIAALDKTAVSLEKVAKYPVVKSVLDTYISQQGGCYSFDAQLGLATIFDFGGTDGKSTCNLQRKDTVEPFIIPLKNNQQLRVRLLVSPEKLK